MKRLSLLGCETPAPLPWQTRCRILCETLRALTYLHGYDGPHVLHLDVKPSNILLDERCHVLLAATGTATQPPTGQARQTMADGGYLDPLVASSGGVHSTLTDGYAFGATIIATLTGYCAGPNLLAFCEALRECPLPPGVWGQEFLPADDCGGGAWSKEARSGLVTVAYGLMVKAAKDRISLDVALYSLEEIAEKAAGQVAEVEAGEVKAGEVDVEASEVEVSEEEEDDDASEEEGKETQVEDDQDTEVYEDDDGDEASDDEVVILPPHQI